MADRRGSANARNDVLALRVHQELAVEVLVAGCRVTGEGNAGARVVAHVAEDHRLDVDRGAPGGGDVVHAAVEHRALVVPGAENGLDRAHELLLRILREVGAQLGFVEFLELDDHLLEVVGIQLGVHLDAAGFLHLVDDDLKALFGKLHDDVGIHLDKAAVAVISEPLVIGQNLDPFDDLVVDAEVEDRVHHAGHRGARARTDRNEQRIARVAELFAGDLLHFGEILINLRLDFGGDGFAVFIITGAGLGCDGEALRDRHAEVGHLGQVRALSAEQLAHLAVALGEKVDILVTHLCVLHPL